MSEKILRAIVILILAAVLVKLAAPFFVGGILDFTGSATINVVGCQETTGSGTYTLTDDIVCTDSHGFNITHDNVILDCDGYSITGGDNINEHGVYALQVSDITIRNCHIQDTDRGIYAQDIDGLTVENSNTSSSRSAIQLYTTNNTIIDGLTDTRNTGYGISLNEVVNLSMYDVFSNHDGLGAVEMFISNNVLFHNLQVYNTTQESIYAEEITNFTVRHALLSTTRYGIYLYDTHDIVFENVTSMHSTYEGIYIEFSTNINLSKTRAFNNTDGIVFASDASNILMNDSTSCYNNHSGGAKHDLSNASTTLTIENMTCNTADAGTPCDNACPLLCGSTITEDTTLTDSPHNLSYGTICPDDGILIGTNNLVLDCQGYNVTGNDVGTYGIRVSGYDNTTIRNCPVSHFVRGIYLYRTQNGLVDNVNVSHSPLGVGLDEVNNETVENVIIYNTSQGIYSSGTTPFNHNITVTNVSIYDATGISFYISGWWYHAALDNIAAYDGASTGLNLKLHNSTANNLIGHRNKHGVVFWGTNITADNISTINSTEKGIFSRESSELSITNGHAENNEYGMYIELCKYCNYTNITTIHNTESGIYLKHYSPSYPTTSGFNRFENVFIDDSGPGVHFWRTDNNTMINVSVYNSSGEGMLFDDADNNTVITGHIENSAAESVEILHSNYNTITNMQTEGGLNSITLTASNFTTLAVDARNAGTGAYLYQAHGTAIANSTITNMSNYGIHVQGGNGTLVRNVTINNSTTGIKLGTAYHTNITDSVIQNNTQDFSISKSRLGCLNSMTTTNGTGGYPLLFLNTSSEVQDTYVSGVTLCDADYSNLTNLETEGTTKDTITVWYSDNINLSNINISDKVKGIIVENSNNVNMSNILVSNTTNYGIYMYEINDTQLTNINTTQSAIAVYGQYLKRIILENLLLEHSTTGGIIMSNSDRVHISNSTVTNASSTGISVNNIDNGTINATTVTDSNFGFSISGNNWSINASAHDNTIYGLSTDVSNSTINANVSNSRIGVGLSGDNTNVTVNTTGNTLMGVRLTNADYNSIDAIISNASTGMYTDNANYNTLVATIHNSSTGMYLGESTYNTVLNTTITDTLNDGAYTYLSSFITFDNTSVAESTNGIKLDQSNDIDILNTVINGSSRNAAYIVLSSNTTFSDVTITDAVHGVRLNRAGNTTLVDSTITDTIQGMSAQGVLQDVPTVSTTYIDVDPTTATSANNEDYLSDFENYTLQEDSAYLTYALPFTFPFLGRSIRNITVGIDGYIKLRELGEVCSNNCYDDYYYHEEGSHIDEETDSLFAYNADLETDWQSDAYMGIFNYGSYVVVEWYSSTREDYDTDTHPIQMQIVLHQDGTIDWNTNQSVHSAVDQFDGDLFTGAYSEDDVEFTIGYDVPPKKSYSADFSTIPTDKSCATPSNRVNITNVAFTDSANGLNITCMNEIFVTGLLLDDTTVGATFRYLQHGVFKNLNIATSTGIVMQALENVTFADNTITTDTPGIYLFQIIDDSSVIFINETISLANFLIDDTSNLTATNVTVNASAATIFFPAFTINTSSAFDSVQDMLLLQNNIGIDTDTVPDLNVSANLTFSNMASLAAGVPIATVSSTRFVCDAVRCPYTHYNGTTQQYHLGVTAFSSYSISNCGNGVVDSGEDCDDGNVAGDDSCPSNCQIPSSGTGGSSSRRSSGGSVGTICVPEWECGVWSDCADGEQRRACHTTDLCQTYEERTETQSCVMETVPEPKPPVIEKPTPPEPKVELVEDTKTFPWWYVVIALTMVVLLYNGYAIYRHRHKQVDEHVPEWPQVSLDNKEKVVQEAVPTQVKQSVKEPERRKETVPLEPAPPEPADTQKPIPSYSSSIADLKKRLDAVDSDIQKMHKKFRK